MADTKGGRRETLLALPVVLMTVLARSTSLSAQTPSQSSAGSPAPSPTPTRPLL